jgi:hypothetical protein
MDLPCHRFPPRRIASLIAIMLAKPGCRGHPPQDLWRFWWRLQRPFGCVAQDPLAVAEGTCLIIEALGVNLSDSHALTADHCDRSREGRHDGIIA